MIDQVTQAVLVLHARLQTHLHHLRLLPGWAADGVGKLHGCLEIDSEMEADSKCCVDALAIALSAPI